MFPFLIFKKTDANLDLIGFWNCDCQKQILLDLNKGERMRNSIPITQNQGFTLVELMVVVAIIGILSSVAIPNFRRYQAQSKTSEAKLQLSGLYSAQTSAFAEYGTYVSCLPTIGFDPSPEFGQRYYAVGFSAAQDTPNAAAVTNGLTTCAAGGTFLNAAAGAGTSNFGFGAAKRVGNVTASAETWYNTAVTATIPAAGNTFVAAAAGPIHPDFVATGAGAALASGCDVWQINQVKVLAQFRRGF
jgi:type IV pilus assembly protein PilA